MFLNAKKMAFLGLLLAISVILVILSGILEFNTLFLLAAASFGVGIAIREYGLSLGLGFFIGAIFLSFLLAPNKIYCITFTAMGLYNLINEFAWIKLVKVRDRSFFFWMIKYMIFNAIYLPLVFIMPHLFYTGDISTGVKILLIAGGQVALFLFDKAYTYFQIFIWNKFRKHFFK